MNFKDRYLRPGLAALGLLFAAASGVHATAPGLLTYQGRLKESGLPVTAVRTVTISFCTTAVGATCTPSPSGAQSVSVFNGLFRTTFTVPSAISLETGAWYLNVNVNAQDFSPRELLSANVYSIYASSAATLVADPGASYVSISTPVSFGAQDASGYSVVLSSGLNAPAGTISAKYFVGDGSALTGVNSNKVSRLGDSMVGPLNMVGTTIYLTGPDGNIVSAASVTASAFFGNGAGLTGVTAAEQNTFASSKTIAGDVLVQGNSQIKASSAAFVYGVTAGTGTFTGGVSATGGTYGFHSIGVTFDFYGTGDSYFAGNAGIGGMGAGKASILGTGTAFSLLVTTNAVTLPPNLVVANSGFVGISTGAPAAALDVEGGARFGLGAAKIVAYSSGALHAPYGIDAGSASFTGGVTAASGTFLASGAAQYSVQTASGINVLAGAVTAPYFYGNGSGLTGLSGTDSTKVAKTGDTMSGDLSISGATLTVNGAIASTGTVGDAYFSGAGTRFMWVPSSGAIRAGSVAGAQWDSIGAHSAAFGESNAAAAPFSAVSGGTGNTVIATANFGAVAGGNSNSVTGVGAAIGGGLSNSAGGNYASVPGGANNNASGNYSFTAGAGAQSVAAGSFVWAGSATGLDPVLNSALPNEFLVRAMGGFDIHSSSFNFGNGTSTFVYVDASGLAMMAGSSITLSGPGGVIVTQSSITAGVFYGDGSHLLGVNAGSAVQKSGDTMSGDLNIDNSTLTVNGPIVSTGTAGGAVVAGPGTRFMWVPSSAAIRAGQVAGTQWDPGSIGQFSTAFGSNNTASAIGSSVGGGSGNTASGIYSRVGGGASNQASNSYATVPGGFSNSATGTTAFAAGYNANAAANGSFMWGDGLGSAMANTVANSVLFRSAGGFDVQSSSFNFGNGVSTFVYVDASGLTMLAGSSITLSGPGGVIVTQSSITAGVFYGDGSHLLGVNAGSAVQKSGDTMSGDLNIFNSTLTVNGPIVSTGTAGGALIAGPGTRFMWVPSSAAIRAGIVDNTQWDPASIGAESAAFGSNSTASGPFSFIGGGQNNLVTGSRGVIAGGDTNSVTNNSAAVGGGGSNLAGGAFSVVPGGNGNQASGDYSFAGGDGAHATHTGSFVWASGAVPAGFGSLANEEVAFRANGGVRFVTGTSTFTIGAGGSVGVGTLLPLSTLDVNGSAAFGAGVMRSTFNAAPGGSVYALQASSGVRISGGGLLTLTSGGGIVFGDGSVMATSPSGSFVSKFGDTMFGPLTVNSSATFAGGTLSVNGNPLAVANGVLMATGSVDNATLPTGAGSRFLWVPSMSAIRAGSLTSQPTDWDLVNIGANSVAFGMDTKAVGTGATVGGGNTNAASLNYDTVGGGQNNTAGGSYSTIAGGSSNGTGGSYGTVPGGVLNHANGYASFAAGAAATAQAGGSFIWADSPGGAPASVQNNIPNSFLARAMGGFQLLSSSFSFSNAVSTFMYIDHTGRVGLSTGAPQASLDVAAQAGDANAAIFRDASGVAVASVTTGGVFAGVQQWSFTLYDPQGLETVDDIPAIISNRLGEPVTITEVWCESDDATATINLHRTASAAATYLMPADMACGTAGSSTTAFQSGEDQLAAGATLDMLTQTVTTGAAHRINVVVKYAVH